MRQVDLLFQMFDFYLGRSELHKLFNLLLLQSLYISHCLLRCLLDLGSLICFVFMFALKVLKRASTSMTMPHIKLAWLAIVVKMSTP